jgi:hypothetical protein
MAQPIGVAWPQRICEDLNLVLIRIDTAEANAADSTRPMLSMWFHASPFRINEGDCVQSAKVLKIDPASRGRSIEDARANGYTREHGVHVYTWELPAPRVRDPFHGLVGSTGFKLLTLRVTESSKRDGARAAPEGRGWRR